MNYSKILLAGITGFALVLIIRKMLQRQNEIFDDIIFDSEFIPGFKRQFSLEENGSGNQNFRHPKLHAEDSENPMFI